MPASSVKSKKAGRSTGSCTKSRGGPGWSAGWKNRSWTAGNCRSSRTSPPSGTPAPARFHPIMRSPAPGKAPSTWTPPPPSRRNRRTTATMACRTSSAPWTEKTCGNGTASPAGSMSMPPVTTWSSWASPSSTKARSRCPRRDASKDSISSRSGPASGPGSSGKSRTCTGTR